MENPEIASRHGQFTDILGPSHKFDDITFAPASVELDGSIFQPAYLIERS